MGEKQFDKIDGRRQDAGNIKPVYLLADRTASFLDASLEGRDRHKHYVNQAPGAGLIVLTDAALVLNIPEGQLFVATNHTVALHTLSDDCLFQMGWCNAVDGGGAFTAYGHEDILKSGAAQSVLVTERHTYIPPLIFRYSHGVRSITFAVTPSGAATAISCGFAGFFMQE